MGKRYQLWLVGLALLGLSSCSAGQGGSFAGAVGMQEAQLVAQKGQPQKIIDVSDGGKILVYESSRMDQMAIMGTGAWGKPEQINYWLDAQGNVTKVDYYPYGKRKFLFPSGTEPQKIAAAPTPAIAPAQPLPPPVSPREEIKTSVPTPSPAVTVAPPLPAAAPATPPQKATTIVSEPTAPKLSTDPKGMREASRLEHGMSKADVTRLLGLPDRTEGFRVDEIAVLVWSYRFSDQAGRQVLTPLIFENSRLIGWGDAYYQMLLRKVRAQSHLQEPSGE
jgi:hypothetical protein